MSGAALVISDLDMLAFEGAEGLAHYCAAKFGVVGFTEAAALQVARDNVPTNAIASGPILMPVLAWVKNEKRPSIPLGAYDVLAWLLRLHRQEFLLATDPGEISTLRKPWARIQQM